MGPCCIDKKIQRHYRKKHLFLGKMLKICRSKLPRHKPQVEVFFFFCMRWLHFVDAQKSLMHLSSLLRIWTTAHKSPLKSAPPQNCQTATNLCPFHGSFSFFTTENDRHLMLTSVGDKTGEGLRLGEKSGFELALWRERREIAHQETGLLFREGESAN